MDIFLHHRAWQYHIASCSVQNRLGKWVISLGKRDFARFKFKIHFGRISYIAQGPRPPTRLLYCHRGAIVLHIHVHWHYWLGSTDQHRPNLWLKISCFQLVEEAYDIVYIIVQPCKKSWSMRFLRKGWRGREPIDFLFFYFGITTVIMSNGAVIVTSHADLLGRLVLYVACIC